MTTNQLAYWNLEEQKRANKAKETENKRHNIADEKFNIAKQTDNWNLEKYKIQSDHVNNRGVAWINALGKFLPSLMGLKD